MMRQKKSYLNHAKIKKYAFLFPCPFQINLLNIHKNVFILISSSNLLLVCLLQSYHKNVEGVHNVLNPSDLTFLCYRVSLCFILYLKRTKNKHDRIYFKL